MQHVTSVGLDVHARSIKAASLNYLTGEVQHRSFKNSPAEVAEWILSLESPKAVYESGVTGFHLVRELRALEDAREELSASKQRLSKFLLRHGFCFDETNERGQRKKAWGRAWWDWLGRIEFGDAADAETLDYYVDRVRSCEAEKRRLDKLVAKHAQLPRWRMRVDALRCVKGIETAIAFALVVEADTFSRFSSAEGFAAWCGLVPSEHSSGEHRAQGASRKRATSTCASC